LLSSGRATASSPGAAEYRNKASGRGDLPLSSQIEAKPPETDRLTAGRKVCFATYPGVATLRILNGGSDRVKVVDTFGERLSG
jgi:hypothetical protein